MCDDPPDDRYEFQANCIVYVDATACSGSGRINASVSTNKKATWQLS